MQVLLSLIEVVTKAGFTVLNRGGNRAGFTVPNRGGHYSRFYCAL
jgi:hypothetical protein